MGEPHRVDHRLFLWNRAGDGAASGRGWLVYATARQPGTLGSLAEAGCRTLPQDVTDETSMRTAVEQAQAEQSGLDALVNDAGYSQSGALETVPMT